MRSRQRGALFLLPILLVGLATAVVLAPSRHRVEALAATNACKSNATATFSDISIGLSGTATPGTTTVGAGTVTLSGIGFSADVPAGLLVAGYNLGLLTAGANSIPVKGWVGIAGSNTAEHVQQLTFTANVTTTITDPNGLPGTGDETATPLAVNLTLPNAIFTPTGGNVSFTQAGAGSLAVIPAGQAGAGPVTPVGGIYMSASVAGGLVRANFDCQVGTTIPTTGVAGTSGTTFTPGTPGAFATVTVTGGTTTTTTPPSSSSSTTSSSTTTPGGTSPNTTTPAVTTTAPPPPVSGKSSYTTDCTNTVTPDHSSLVFGASGQAPSRVDSNTSFTMSAMKWSVTIPDTVFTAGLGLGLITPGTPINGTLTLSITGTNTAEGTQNLPKINLSVPVLVDGAGAAKSSTVAFNVPNVKWTAGTGTMNFSMHGASVAVKLGVLNVAFECKATKGGPFLRSAAGGAANTGTSVASEAPGGLVATGPRDNLWMQLVLAVLLLDLGYLTLSLRRSPRRR